jgi:hypothetical protein
VGVSVDTDVDEASGIAGRIFPAPASPAGEVVSGGEVVDKGEEDALAAVAGGRVVGGGDEVGGGGTGGVDDD